MSTEPASQELSGLPADARASVPVPPWLLVVCAVTIVQMGAAVAEGLFETIGFASVVFLRCFIGGLIFLGLVRPRVLGYSRRVYLLIAIYGITIAANMLTFYAAIDRIPLGIAVAIAFAGPLIVSVAGSRRAIDLIWVALAAAGILLLSPITDATLDPVGLLLAFVCAFAWGTYIIVTKRAGNALPGNTMLTLSMCVAAVVAAPFGAVRAVEILRDPSLIGLAIIVALMSSVIPFWLEFKALRSLAPRVFSLLLSLEPAAAVIMGWLILHESLGIEKIIGIGMVTIAAAATTRTS
jgi:inner membrane transporter RhtA